MPRYRKLTTDFIISKIDYGVSNTVLHFRFIATADKEQINFYGCQHANAWKIGTNQRPTSPDEVLTRAPQIRNIRINDVRQAAEIAANGTLACKPQRGDIISCEIHFANMPHHVKAINLTNGEIDKAGTPRFVCYDIQIKSQGGGLLGDKTQMQNNIAQFYKTVKTVRYPSIVEVTTLEQDSIFESGQKTHEQNSKSQAILAASKPIDYMPRILQSAADLNCHERLILQNVYFDDNNAEFTRRLQAMKTIMLIVEYLQHYPDAKVALHGHTDIAGDPYNNLVLSEKRVIAVQRAIIDKGIDRKRVLINYYGGQYPLPLYKDGGPMNRRVEAEIICPNK